MHACPSPVSDSPVDEADPVLLYHPTASLARNACRPTVELVPGNTSDQLLLALSPPVWLILAVSARQAKQRPLTDPLIVHVPDTASALAVVDFEVEGGGGQKARRLLDLLGEKLWPGKVVHVGLGRA